MCILWKSQAGSAAKQWSVFFIISTIIVENDIVGVAIYSIAIYFIIVDIVGVAIYSIAIYFIIADIAGVAIYSLVARTIASLGCTDQRPGGDCIINKDAPNYFYTLYISHYKCLNLIQKAATL